jgi:hypothetical protein
MPDLSPKYEGRHGMRPAPGGGDSEWRRASSCSVDRGCVETAHFGDTYAVRDSKKGEHSPTLLFTKAEWKRFIDGVKACEFDYDTA